MVSGLFGAALAGAAAWLLRLVVLMAAAVAADAARAQGYPNRVVRIVAPIAPGGATDILSRMIAHRLYETWGQVVQVDNRPGAGGMIGSAIVARSPPDGYTLLMAFTSHATNPSLQQRLPYRTFDDFAPVTMIAVVPNVLLVHPSLPVHTVKELIAFVKARPGDINCATSGIGTSTHLAALLFGATTGAIMEHVHYRGGAPALYDLLGGQVSVMFGNMASSLSRIHAGRLRALAVTSIRRSAILPHLPTMIEAGLPGFEATGWFALLAPAGTPGQIINKLNAEITAILQHPDFRQRLQGLGAEVRTSTPGELNDYIRAEATKWAKVIKDLGVRLD
ncbi:MAG: tripartite tricarboxylate transporter substrate binding protein [Burkholderiales bacterium]|nr:tripartite tricarboxylate transporter substrate binding protein [Burkholderiales bacterium]